MQLVTWNIQRGRGPGGTCSLDRVVADLRRVADADVLCLQEVSAGYTDLPGSDGGDQFAELASRLPDYTAVAGVVTDTQHTGRQRTLFGNMIFSRYPVLQVFRHNLPWPADPAVMSMQRGALEVTLDTPFGLLRVSTTHLEYFSLAQRMAQAERLRELHREAVLQARASRPGDADAGPFRAIPRAAPAILTGDCNFFPGSKEHLALQAPFDDDVPAYRDAWQLAHPGQPHAPTVCLRDPEPFTFDYVFVSGDLAPRVRQVRVDVETNGPDHQPVLLELA